MEKYCFNRSQKNIWMNEKAYPGKAVNTIALRMYFPEHKAAIVCEAVDYIIKNADIFRAVLSSDNQFTLVDTPISCCFTGVKISRCEADKQADWREKQPFPAQKLYDASVWPIQEGGSLLSFCFHHILLDGFGMCLIAQQILNYLEQKKVELPDFFGRDYKNECQNQEQEKDFWLKYMEGLNTKESLFEQDVAGLSKSSYKYTLPDKLAQDIEAYSQKNNVTVPSILSTAFCIYMSRGMECEDVIFHMPRLNRDADGLKKIAGCYTIVVPVRVTVDEREGFLSLCRTVQSQSRLATQHKNYDYHQMLADLRQQEIIGKDLSRYTLNFYTHRLEADLPYTIEFSVGGSMHNHLTFNVFHLKDTYEISYDVRDGVYDFEKIEFFHKAFLTIVENGMTGNCCIEQLEAISTEERKKLLFELMGEELHFDQNETIPGLFYKAVLKYGTRNAVYAGKNSFTYVELDKASNRVANALLNRGIKSGDFVMFMLQRDHRLLPVMLGILKSGAVFVPVDPAYPKGRIDYMIQNCRASLFISDSDIPNVEQYEFVSATYLLNGENQECPSVTINQDQPAYCIYTSGTTGKPKGVLISHKGIVNITLPENNPFNKDICKSGKGIAAIGSICFDISIFEIFVPLLNGMFVELVPDHGLADPKELSLYIKAHKANILHCTPSRLATYLTHPDFCNAMKQMDVILSAGEVLPGALTERIQNDYGVRMYNGYGPTEATIGTTITRHGDTTTIGKPIANAGILVIDKKGRLLPFGAVGELAVYGSGVGIGYLRMEELTREKFCQVQGRRVYRTGDLGYYTKNGCIIFQGRNDKQIKLRGLRIELSEIENSMLSFRGIGQAAVLVRKIGENEHLAGFYSARQGIAIEEENLKAHLKENLALYMVPDILQKLDQIPHTSGGKTDYQALNEITIDYTRNYRKPQTRLEQSICEAYESVLMQKPIGMDDHFFELGGTSLDVARLIVEIEERVRNIDLNYGDLFKYPTPELISAYLNASGQQPGSKNLLEDLDYSGFKTTWEDTAEHEEKADSLGNILLTGCTGYLGNHLLCELLKQPELTEHIYCLIRPKGKLSAEQRLKNTLFYYHDHDFGTCLREKVTVIEGDLTSSELFLDGLTISVDTIIHSAANVAHFAYGDILEKINTTSVKQLLSFCKKQSAQLIHISTISVGGVQPVDEPELILKESDLFIGQEIHSSYVLSKYMAEYELLKQAFEKNVKVKIMRVGNLQGRISDGEFQMNIRENAFTRQLSGYVKLGKVPKSLYESSVNFSPVDEVARVILLLSRAGSGKKVFHVYPKEEIRYAALFEKIQQCGYTVSVVSDDEFCKWTDFIRREKEGRLLMKHIFIDKADQNFAQVASDHTLTLQLLCKWKDGWKKMTEEYFKRYIEVLDGMMLFEK